MSNVFVDSETEIPEVCPHCAGEVEIRATSDRGIKTPPEAFTCEKQCNFWIVKE